MRQLKNNPELNKETLYRTRGPRAPLWYTIYDLGLDRLFQYGFVKGNPPPIGLVSSLDNQRVGGRFFPRLDKAIFSRKSSNKENRTDRTAILAYSHEDNLITVGTVVHELAHLAMYCNICKHTPTNKLDESQCKYKGEHSKAFYDTLEPMYKAVKIPTYAAVIIEGKYPYPQHWDNGSYSDIPVY